MSQPTQEILSDDILIRRVPPSSDSFATVAPTGTGRLRAASQMMSVRDNEDALSCSLLRLTSPIQLLENLRSQHIDPTGWQVCAFLVHDVHSLEFEVEFSPITGSDIGHCGIRTPLQGGPKFQNAKAKRLAKLTIILNEEEIRDPSRIHALFK